MTGVRINSEDELESIMMGLIFVFVFLGIIGSISCYYQLTRLKHLHAKHSTEAKSLPNQRSQIDQLKKLARDSRADMQQHLAGELEELRAFQMEVSGQLSTLKMAMVELSRKRQLVNNGGRAGGCGENDPCASNENGVHIINGDMSRKNERGVDANKKDE